MSNPSTSSPLSSLIDRLNGPSDPRHAALAQPLLRGAHQCREDLWIVDRLQKAEVAGGVPMALEMASVDLRADPADRHAVAVGQPVANLDRPHERILGRIEMIQPLEGQRLHPIRVVGIDRSGSAR